MQKPNRRLAVALLTLVLAGLVPGANREPPQTIEHMATATELPPRVQELLRHVTPADDPFVDLDLLVETADQEDVQAAVRAAGGEITSQEQTFVRVRVPIAAAANIPKLAAVKGVGVNQSLQIDPSGISAQGNQIGGSLAALTSSRANLQPIGVDAFRAEFGARGDRVVVAVVDSGVDPGHPALNATQDGRAKIIDWKDFTREGYVSTDQQVSLSARTYVTKDSMEYRLPNVAFPNRTGYFGYLDEQYVTGYINQDLDRNGLKIDRFGVLIVDGEGTGTYDTAFIDSNHDYNFGDEIPLHVFRESREYTSLGEYREGLGAARRLNTVVADLSPDGQWVRLGFDGLGHGTWVSGIVGAYTPDGFQGVAPGVQVMALKALRSTGGGDWFDIKEAILYAARNGADIINLSVGDLATGAAKAFDTGASEWLDQIASQYGVLIVLAAGNSGPGLSSGATLGSPSQVIAAGSYFSPEMWARDYGWSVPHESIWFFSGMGPRSDGTYLPSVVAPGGSPAPSPTWRDATGYATAIGTSVATPHVAGAAALIMDAGRRNGVAHDWLSVKRALEMGARKISGFEVYEQGSGLVQLRSAYSHLEQINSLPALKARTADGQGGLLARAFAPGSTQFQLANLDTEPARVGIYSSEPWVRPAFTSMLLPTNVPRALTLQFDPPKQPGAHSAFVTVTHQQKYGPSLLLPVTHLQPFQLDASTDYSYRKEETLEAGRYQRYFLKVEPGAAGLTVNARMAINNGSIQVHVFRPDGQPLHVGKIGVTGEGLTTLFQTDAPVPGVWEVVVVALPDPKAENANPSFTLEARVRPGALGNQPLTFSVAPGTTATFPVKVGNYFDAAFSGGLSATGLISLDQTDSWAHSLPWRVQFRRSAVVETFTLREFVGDLQVEISNPVRVDPTPSAASAPDLSLYLYRARDDGSWELKGLSTTPGGSRERVHLSNLVPGTYRVVVTSATDDEVQYQYRRLLSVDKGQASVKDEFRTRAPGETWTVPLTIKAPTTPGRYTGQLQLWDTAQQKILGWYPFEVSVGQPTLSIRPMDAQLTRGRPSEFVLEVRDSRDQRLLSGVTLTVNGQRYLSVHGQVSVRLTPQSDLQTVDVEADVPSFKPVRERFTLPVRDAWGLYPIGIDQNEENSNWRRKVINQLSEILAP